MKSLKKLRKGESGRSMRNRKRKGKGENKVEDKVEDKDKAGDGAEDQDQEQGQNQEGEEGKDEDEDEIQGYARFDFGAKLSYVQDGQRYVISADALRKVYWRFKSKGRIVKIALPKEEVEGEDDKNLSG